MVGCKLKKICPFLSPQTSLDLSKTIADESKAATASNYPISNPKNPGRFL